MKTRAKIAVLLLLLAGCNRQDTEALQRISRKVVARSEPITSAARWQGASPEAGLEARVAARLRWDKQLADLTFEVKAAGPIVEIKGKVRNLEERRRAVMLAESTTGVENVRDALVESER